MDSKQTDLHVRIPEPVAQRLRECAQENDRTLNAEIVRRLRNSLDGYSQTLQR